MKTYDIFLFDADDTLFDFDKAEANALKIVFGNYGFDYAESMLQKYREINVQQWEKYERGEITSKELKTSRFEGLFDYMSVDCNAGDFNDKYLYELGKGAYLIDGALKICKKIVSCGKLIYIVTNGLLAVQTSRIKHSIIKDYITDFFVSELIGYQKPHTSYFEYVFAHIPKIGRDKILIIGDSLAADIQGGKSAGIDSCWLNPTGKVNQTDIIPTYEISNLSELQKFI